MVRPNFKELCMVCGKETDPMIICNQYVEKQGKIIKVCKGCLMNGDFESKYGE